MSSTADAIVHRCWLTQPSDWFLLVAPPMRTLFPHMAPGPAHPGSCSSEAMPFGHALLPSVLSSATSESVPLAVRGATLQLVQGGRRRAIPLAVRPTGWLVPRGLASPSP